MPLTAEQIDKLTGQVEQANKRLEETSTAMNKKQEEIAAALMKMTALEKANSDGGTERTALRERLDKLATEVESVAKEHTNLLEQNRKAMLQLGASGQVEHKAFMFRGEGSRGSVFESRQQAVELGYFFMATMKKDCEAKQYARRWLREHAPDLRYLPNIPNQLVQELGANMTKVMESCQRHGLHYTAQALSGTVTPGSALVFPAFAQTFIRNVSQYGVFRQDALVWPMGSDTVYLPRRTSGMTIHWIGEAAAVAASDPGAELLQMICKKAMMLHYYSSELAEDENAAISLADIIMFEIALTFAQEEDRIGFLGTGAGGDNPGYAGFKGLLGITGQALADEDSLNPDVPLVYTAGTGLDRTDEMTRKGLLTWVSYLSAMFEDGAAFYGHRTVLFDIMGIETTGGGPAFDFVKGVRTILGYPARAVHCMPKSPGTASTAVAAFANLRKAWVLGDRRRPEIETSDQFKFDTDQLAVRGIERVAIRQIDARAVVQYKTAA